MKTEKQKPQTQVRQKRTNIQDTLLNACRKEEIKITIFTTNGVPIMGHVIAFDDFTILMMAKGQQQLLYKSALSTIVPSKPVTFTFGGEAEKQ